MAPNNVTSRPPLPPRRSPVASYRDSPTSPSPSPTPSFPQPSHAENPVCNQTYFQQIVRPPQNQPRSPLDSPHCLGNSVTDIWSLIQAFRDQPLDRVEEILRQAVDHGDQNIQLSVPLIPGHYANNIEIRGGGMLAANLQVHDGQLRGSLHFRPGLIRHDPEVPIPGLGRQTIPGMEAEITRIDISTDTNGQIRFTGHINLFGFDYTQDITQDMTPTLFGRAEPEVHGPLSHVLRRVIAYYSTLTPAELQARNLVDASAARFRVDINPPQGATPLDPLGRVSHARVRLPQINLGHGLTINDIAADVTVTPDGMRGLHVQVADAHLGEVRHHTDQVCGAGATPDAVIENLRLQNTSLGIVFRNPNNPTDGVYVERAQGELVAGRTDLHGDVVVPALTEPIRVSLAGNANGRATLDLHHPNLTLASANVTANIPTRLPAGANLPDILLRLFRGERIETSAVNAQVTDAGIRTGHLHLEVSNIFDVTARDTMVRASFPTHPVNAYVGGIATSGSLLAGYEGIAHDLQLSLGQPDVNISHRDNSLHLQGSIGLSTSGYLTLSNPARHERLTAGLGEFTCHQVTFNGHATEVIAQVGVEQCSLRGATITGDHPQLGHATLTAEGRNFTADASIGRGLSLNARTFDLTARTNVRSGRTHATGSVHAAADNTDRGGRGFSIQPDSSGSTHRVDIDTHLGLRGQVAGLGRAILQERVTARLGLQAAGLLHVLDLDLPLLMPQAGSLSARISGTGSVNGRSAGHHTLRVNDSGSGRLRAHLDASIPRLGFASLDLPLRLLGLDPSLSYYDLLHLRGVDASLRGGLRTNGNGSVALGGDAHVNRDRGGVHYRGTVTASANELNIPRILRNFADIRLPSWFSAATASLTGVTPEGTRPQPVRANFHGTNLNVRATTLPARLAVDTTLQTQLDNHPVNIRIHGHLDASSLSVRTSRRGVTLATNSPETAPQLTGPLTVTFTGPQREVYGEATVNADAFLQATQRIGRGGPANLSLVDLRATVTEPIALPGASVIIPAGTTLRLPIRRLPLQITEHGHGSRTIDLAFPDVDQLEFSLPSIRLAGFGPMRNVAATLTLTAQGQRWNTQLDEHGLAHLEAMPRPDGSLAPARLSLRLNGEAADTGAPNPQLTVGLDLVTTRTVENRNAQGEEVHTITGLHFGVDIDGQAPSPSGALINLRNIHVSSPLGNLRLIRNPETGTVRLELPPSPFIPTPLPTSYEDWMRMTPEQWGNIIGSAQRGTHTLVFENLEHIPSLTDIFPLPLGAGRVFVDLDQASVTELSRPQSVADLTQTLRRVLLAHAYREFPNPPVRQGSSGPALVYNDSQRPNTGGTVFFIRQTNTATGTAEFADSHWAARFASETGISRETIDGWINNGRVEMPELVAAIRQISLAATTPPSTPRHLGDILSAEAVQGFVVSYLREEQLTGTIGTQFRHPLDQLSLGIGQLRHVAEALPNNGRVTPVDQAISDPYFFSPEGNGTVRPGHFDGSCNQVTSFVAIPPERALQFLQNHPDADTWMSSISRSDSSVRGSLFGRHNVVAETTQRPFGSVLTYHLNQRSGEVAGWSRTVRLLPVTHNGIQGTLVLWTEYIDAPGDEATAHIPEMEHRPNRPFTFANFADSLVGSLPLGSRSVTPEPFALDRITHMLREMNARGNVPLTYATTTAEPSRVFPNVNLIRFNADAGTIEIPTSVSQAQLLEALTPLGVSAATVTLWFNAHQVNVGTLLQETGLTDMGVPLFMDHTRVTFRDPVTYSSPSERWFIMIRDFRRLYQAPSNTVHIRLMRDARFTRARYTTEPGATRDPAISEMYIRVRPPSGNLTPENFMAYMHHYERHHEWASSQFAPSSRPMIIETVSDRRLRRIPTNLIVPFAGHSLYDVYSPENLISLPGGTLFSEFDMIPNTASGTNVRMQYNRGFYFAGIDAQGNMILRRGNVIDTNMSDLTGPAAAEARDGVRKHFGWTCSRALNLDLEAFRFTLGTTLDENDQPVN